MHPLERPAAHLCLDMQRLFVEDTPWRAAWAERVLPKVQKLSGYRPAATVFTRFIPARRPDEAVGAWRDYYERWSAMTLEQLEPSLLDLAPPLQEFVPPALTLEKEAYSAFHAAELSVHLVGRKIETVIVSGLETDMCVLSTVLDAIDLGYRVVIATDAICSSSDETHDALLKLYAKRFSVQILPLSVEEIMDAWK